MTALHYEQLRQVTPQASVLLQRNPGPMTLDGTNTWLLRVPGVAEAIVVDPGETDDEHHAALVRAAGSIALVLVTHRHHDHSQAAPALHDATGAPVRALDPEHCRGAAPLTDGELIDSAGVRVRVLGTPGHTSDSVCFVLESDAGVPAAVLTGDTILGRGTTVVAHPDGALGPYLASLHTLHSLGALAVLPGHGPELPSLAAVSQEYLTHREERLAQVRESVARLGPDATARQIVEDVYADVDESVWWAAELSVRAQLDYLRDDLRGITERGGPGARDRG
jgi:glyoxylase-like metal-dependent hydrolase (beta-lactamase superfamily II)